MKQRAITALFFVGATLCGVYGGKISFFLLTLAIAAGCLWELMGLLTDAAATGALVRKLLGVVLGLSTLALVVLSTSGGSVLFWGGGHALYLFLNYLVFLLPFGALIFELFFANPRPFQNVAAYTLGVFYICLPLYFLVRIAIPDSDYFPNRVFGLLWLVWTNDTLAYLIGSRIGRTKLFERISPKKTWEGTLGGVLGTILMAWGMSGIYTEFSLAQWLALGAVVSLFGTLGDLVESMLKRSVGVKDSGSLFPGHGGFLDRFDAVLFMLPFAWVVVEVLGG